MKYLFKGLFTTTFLLGLFFVISPHAQALEENPYISKVHPVSDKNSIIYFDTKVIDLNADSLTFKYDGKTLKEDISWLSSNSEKNSVWFGEYFKAGSTIEVYLNYYEKDDDSKLTSKLIDTLTVIDKTAPSIKTSDLTVRNTSFNIYTEKGAKISCVYNNKLIKVKKSTSTKWIATIPKPLKGKKLIITATDASGNSKKYTKSTTIPYISFLAYDVQASEKQVTGDVSGGKSTDKVQVKIGSKTYKGSVKGSSFKIKLSSKISTPKKVTVYLKDKYGNTLSSDSIRIYKYGKIKIGMTKSQILNSFYGKPDNKSSDLYGKDFYEYWRYDYYDETVYLNFYNGKLSSVSKYKN